MKDVFVKMVKGDMNNPDVRQGVEWLQRHRELSRFDPDVLTYPGTILLQAYERTAQGRRPLLYTPVQRCLMWDALGPNPESSPLDVAAALAELTKTLVWESSGLGWGEFYMPCTDGNVVKFAEAHGYIRQAYNAQTMEKEASKDEQGNEIPATYRLEARDIPFLKFKVFR